jgi:hypothetical protein
MGVLESLSQGLARRVDRDHEPVEVRAAIEWMKPSW